MGWRGNRISIPLFALTAALGLHCVPAASQQQTTYAYDALGRLVGASDRDRSTTYSYDPAGNRVQVVNVSTVIVGTNGADNLWGTSGDDHFTALAADDWMTGGSGNDILDGGSGWDAVALDGGPSNYTLSLNGDNSLRVTSSAGVKTMIAVEAIWFGGTSQYLSTFDLIPTITTGATVTGTAGADLLNGTAAADHFIGLAGDDILIGNGGNDVLEGGDGWDIAYFPGAKANATISLNTDGTLNVAASGSGTDTLSGIEGLWFPEEQQFYTVSDILIALNNGVITGTSGPDSITGSSGADHIYGLGGDDWITGGAGNDTIEGGDGWDAAQFPGSLSSCTYGQNTDGSLWITCPGSGTDTLIGVEAIWLWGEEVYYTVGTLIANLSGGSITGTSGDDWLVGGTGNDTIDGLGGWDAAQYPGSLSACSYTKNSNGSLTISCPGRGTDTLYNIEALWFWDAEQYISISDLP